MHKLNYFLIIIVVTLNLCAAQNKWIWSETKSSQKLSGSNALAKSLHARVDRDREPTTKRPIPGQPQSDDIDDYADTYDERTKQNNPYVPGAVGHPLIAGNYNGFNNYPQIAGFPQNTGNTPNGILVGPGGPTGVIGRPQTHYPAGVPISSFPAFQGGYPGYTGTPNIAGSNNNPGFPSISGLNNFIGQYPFVNPNNPQQYPGAQYPAIQYPQQPQYTEGYGLANTNHGFNVNPHFNGNFNPDYGFGFDEHNAQIQDKSGGVKTLNKKVDDKVTKNLKKL